MLDLGRGLGQYRAAACPATRKERHKDRVHTPRPHSTGWMCLPQTHPCLRKPGNGVPYCGRRTGSRRAPCPCDWAEDERDQEGISRDRRQGKLQADSWFSPASSPECGRQRRSVPSPRLPGWERKRAAAGAGTGHTQVACIYIQTPIMPMPATLGHAGPCPPPLVRAAM